MFKTFLLACLLWIPLGAVAQSVPTNTGNCLNEQEAQLVSLVNAYRVANGKPAVDVSLWVTATGQWHAWDLTANNPVGGTCNMHSWSNASSLWVPVCYDGSSGTQMWFKPFQISGGVYAGRGYENAAGSGSAAAALAMWQQSPPHVDVILNRGPSWGSKTWRSVGVGVVGGYSVLWFSDTADPSTMAPCTSGGGGVDQVFANAFE